MYKNLPMDPNEAQIRLKVVLMGDPAVGKSSIISQICSGEFTDKYFPTIGVEFNTAKDLGLGDHQRMVLWDIHINPKMKAIAMSATKGTHGVVFVYDITKKQSLEHLEALIADFRTLVGASIPGVLVGNKADLSTDRVVFQSDATVFAQKHGLHFFEVSAKDGSGLKEPFLALSAFIKKGSN